MIQKDYGHNRIIYMYIPTTIEITVETSQDMVLKDIMTR